MFSLVFLSGFFTLVLSVPRYIFVNESKTWTEAQRYCREKYTDLVTIENEQQTVQLLDSVNDDSTDLVWIGLYDDLNSWKWTLEGTDFFKAGEKDFRNWFTPEPYVYVGQYCVSINDGIWETSSCSDQYPFICYDGRMNASTSYVWVSQSNSWTEAQRYCREHHTDLVSIRNESENQKIRFLFQNNLERFWIGLYKTRSWSDQSNSSFSNWMPGQPDDLGFCTAVSFSDSGSWTDENCDTAFPFLCYNISSLVPPRQYHFINESKTWSEAQRFCRQNYTDLATIENMEEMNRLISTVNGSFSGLAWIGLYLKSWRWSLEDNDFYQYGERDFRNWYHQPDNYGGTELCVYMNYYGKWFDEPCDKIYPFVCYNDENPTQTYITITDGKNWTEARRYCREHYTDLVNVRNQSENQKIIETVGGGVWIGLYRNRIWSNGQSAEYEDWRPEIPYSPQQPDNIQYDYDQWVFQLCTAVSFSYLGRWTDENCGFSLPFICYKRICTQSSCSHQYHFVYDSKTWTEAQRFCRQYYTDLATIENMEEMKSLIRTVRGTYYGKAWIGLYDDLNSWRWSLDNAALDGGFKNWFVKKPTNLIGQSFCAYMSYKGIWSAYPCDYTLPFLCYDGRVNATTSYVIVDQNKNWTEAQSYCREHHTDLVSIRNETENYKIHFLFQTYTSFYIGLYGTRSWSDQSNSSFSNWMSGEPDNAGDSEYCTAVSFGDSGTWTDENCDTDFFFICYSALASSRQYYLVSESKTWSEAQRFCRQNYTDLATIENMEEMNRLINTVNGSFSGSAWIGLYEDANSWRWSLEDNDFYQDGERDFRNWPHEPDNGPNKMCVYMDKNGNWFDDPCENNFEFVCYDGRENATQEYVFVSDPMTWTGAQSYCKEKYTDLASVRNETERQQILSVKPYYFSSMWIGLHRNRLWSDQSSSSFTYWLLQTEQVAAEPDNGLNVLGLKGAQHCTALSLKYFGQWTDESCFLSLPFFCYSDDYVMGIRMELKSMKMLSESEIEELLNIQFQKKLIELGLPSNVTMHLRDYRQIIP